MPHDPDMRSRRTHSVCLGHRGQVQPIPSIPEYAGKGISFTLHHTKHCAELCLDEEQSFVDYTKIDTDCYGFTSGLSFFFERFFPILRITDCKRETLTTR